MAVRGTKPKPALTIVREGNPGKRPIKEGLKLPPTTPEEPVWTDWFPVTNGAHAGDNQRGRDDARSAWRLVVPVLSAQGVLAKIDLCVLADYCITVARVNQCERDISVHGMWVEGERGAQKNPSVTAANQYRQQLKFYVGELGLSPSSRTRLDKGDPPGDDDNPFDV